MFVEDLLDAAIVTSCLWCDFGRFGPGVGEVFVAELGGAGDEGGRLRG